MRTGTDWITEKWRLVSFGCVLIKCSFTERLVDFVLIHVHVFLLPLNSACIIYMHIVWIIPYPYNSACIPFVSGFYMVFTLLLLCFYSIWLLSDLNDPTFVFRQFESCGSILKAGKLRVLWSNNSSRDDLQLWKRVARYCQGWCLTIYRQIQTWANVHCTSKQRDGHFTR